MSRRLEILNASLSKKKARMDELVQQHFDDVKSVNGQPLNDKRNGRATLARWQRQDNAIRNAKLEIEKTERAIDAEQFKINRVSTVSAGLPEALLKAVAEGRLNQWRKQPNTFFVPGVDKARIVYDEKKRVLCHRYSDQVTDPGQRKLLAETFNTLSALINK